MKISNLNIKNFNNKVFTSRGRLTTAQKIAFETLLKGHSIDNSSLLIEEKIKKKIANYNNSAFLEVGFGSGENLISISSKNENSLFIGAEIYKPGIGKTLNKIKERSINNIYVYFGNAINLILDIIPLNFLTGTMLFFPDPWPKKRHNKRRLINEFLIELLISRTKNNGFIYIKTDSKDYYSYIKEMSFPGKAIINTFFVEKNYQNIFYTEENTKFEKKAIAKNNPINTIGFLIKN